MCREPQCFVFIVKILSILRDAINTPGCRSFLGLLCSLLGSHPIPEMSVVKIKIKDDIVIYLNAYIARKISKLLQSCINEISIKNAKG